MIWREKRVLLIILGLILAANTIFFLTYRVRYEQRLNDLDQKKTESEQRLEGARTARITAERQIAGYRKVQHDIDVVYNERWSTQAERLVPMIKEVKRLAAASQLVPPSYAFTLSEPKADQSGALNATLVGISFAVQGPYQQVRRLINLLELSPQFVIIDTISLTSQNEQNLNLNLHVKTLFRDPVRPARVANPQL
jgi:Tfp pilus assembly protein PilO